MATRTKLQQAITGLTAGVAKERRKALVLGVLIVFLGGMWVRLAMPKTGPKSAAAAPAGGSIDVREPNVTAAPTSENSGLSDWLTRPVARVGRNLFWVNLDYYPREAGAVQPVAVEPDASAFWDRLDKSALDRADQDKQRRVLVANLQAQARRLNVQGTVMGTDPRALINGTMAREGEMVAEFRVLKIEPRGVVVEKEGVRLSVQMK